MTIKHFVPSAVTGLLLSAVVGIAPAAAQRSTALVADSAFMQLASSLSLLQEKLGKVAQDKASSTAVQEFGRQMVAEYAKANQELKEAAKQAAFPRPVLMREHVPLRRRMPGPGAPLGSRRPRAQATTTPRAAVESRTTRLVASSTRVTSGASSRS